MINIDEKSTENAKVEKIIQKKFSKKKENFDMMMFKIVNVKNLKARIFIIYYIDDTMSSLNIITRRLSNSKVF